LTIGWNELILPEQLQFGPSLGAGGSAQVYRGSWQGQEVAIKKISGVAHLQEMKKEVNALRRLRHPRLVRFIGACVQPPQLLVVTEFMSGGSLHDRIFGALRNPPMMPMQKYTIACHMVEGLAFLHSQRVVHRDLKSMNILLDGAGNAKICDFGLAQNMELSATSIPRKLDGEGGSPRYMAPECYDAMHGKLTEKVDIWAIGCIFIELFGGVLPYADCSTMAQLSGRILVEKRPPEMPPTVPPPLAVLTRRCLTFDAPRRPHAVELQGLLDRLRPC
jgi:serine/threonine protein kinase